MSTYGAISEGELVREKERLHSQASLWWSMEREMLRRRLLVEAEGLMVDLGCGEGTISTAVAKEWTGWRVLGLDSDRRILRRRVCLRFGEGEPIFVRDERRPGLGVVVEGKVGFGIPVEGEHHWVEVLHPGDVFGRPERSELRPVADLVAIERTETVLIPADFFDRVAARDLPLALKLSRNLVAVLNHRLNECHRQADLWGRPGP